MKWEEDVPTRVYWISPSSVYLLSQHHASTGELFQRDPGCLGASGLERRFSRIRGNASLMPDCAQCFGGPSGLVIIIDNHMPHELRSAVPE